MKDYDKSKELSYLEYWDVNNLYGQAMSQKLPANDFKWVKDISVFNDSLLKGYNKESGEWFLEVDIQSQEIYITFKMIYHFYLKE